MQIKQLPNICIATFVVLLNACFAFSSLAQTAVQGEIDLSNADVRQVVNLSGGWLASDKLTRPKSPNSTLTTPTGK